MPDSNRPDDRMDVVVDAASIDGPEGLADLVEQASAKANRRTAADPEHTTKRCWHKSELVRGFAAGVIAADPWYRGYRLPPNFERVINRVAASIDKTFTGGEIVHASLNELRAFFDETVMADSEFVGWNKADGPDVVFVHRYSPTPSKRDFIDLDAVMQNVTTVLRNWKRDDDRFEAKFQQDHNAEQGDA